MWERTGECAMTASLARRFKYLNNVEAMNQQGMNKDIVTEDTQDGNMPSNAKHTGQLARYDGTIGFRCRFFKKAPLAQRAEKSAGYPHSLQKTSIANIRFQREHIE